MKNFLEKSSIIDNLFIETADNNYICARWCEQNDLVVDFFWQSAHCIEKYLKAILLYNGRSAKNHSHQIGILYKEVLIFARDLLPQLYMKPNNLDIWGWIPRSDIEIIGHLEKFGNPDNRYLIYGHNKRAEDIHMIDELVFSLRRLACSLDMKYINKAICEVTYRDMLKRDPNFYESTRGPINEIIGQPKNPLRHTLLNMNMSFAPKKYNHTPTPASINYSEPVLFRRILEPLRSDIKDTKETAIEVSEWLLENIQLSRGTKEAPGARQEIEDALKNAKENK